MIPKPNCDIFRSFKCHNLIAVDSQWTIETDTLAFCCHLQSEVRVRVRAVLLHVNTHTIRVKMTVRSYSGLRLLHLIMIYLDWLECILIDLVQLLFPECNLPDRDHGAVITADSEHAS